MSGSSGDRLPRHTGSAICIGLGSFQGGITPGEEPPVDTLPDLPYADAVTRDLAAALTDLGFSCEIYTDKDLPTAKKLGSCVSESLASAASGAHVIHVLSHGHHGKSGVHVVGVDGSWDASTRVEPWVASVEDDPRGQRSHTLFVLDTCYSGQAARLDWLRAATEDTRAWVIAASAPDAPAFNGRLTQAVTSVLRKLKSGELDFSPSTYIPFVYLVDHVRREVMRFGGASQHVTGTPVDGLFEPPLFANPRPALPGSARAAMAEVDPIASPFGDLDPALDPAHFLDRAAGHRDVDLTDSVGFFTGRLHQIAELAGSLDRERASGLVVITGDAGSGKSALLGVLVCALHPRLREPTRRLWRQVPVPDAAWPGPLAAIHLRERTLNEATSALIRQLHLPLPQESTPRRVVQAISAIQEVPLIIFDALDEATEQDAVHRQLLRPLAAAQRPDGSPAAHLWVGTRPWRQFDDLLNDARTRDNLINLDAVPIGQLRTELRDYVEDMLTHASAYEDRSLLQVRRALAQGVADALTAAERSRGGEFLIAALYTHWLDRQSGPPGDSAGVSAILMRIPTDVPAVLDLDLSTRGDQPWLKAILIALAHAHGAGMPAAVLRRAAGAFHSEATSSEISVMDFDRLLRQIRFYLRSTPDSDGTSLYRLFHQSLVDQLNDPDADLGGFVDRIMATVPTGDGGRLVPEAAEPYVQRHWIQHAADAGRIDLLVSAPPAELVLPLNAAARTRSGRLGSAIYRQSAHLSAFQSVHSRWQLLSVDAVRYRFHELARHLAQVTPGSPRDLFPQWATGGSTTPWLRALMVGHMGTVTSVAVGQVEGRTIIVSGGNDGTVRVWDASTGNPTGTPITGHKGAVHALAIGRLQGRTIVVSGGDDKIVRVWDASTGNPIGIPITGHKGAVHALAIGRLQGRMTIVSGAADGTVRVWDTGTGSPSGRPLKEAFPDRARISGVTIGEVDGRASIICCTWDGAVRVYDAATRKRTARYDTPTFSEMRSIAIGEIDGLVFFIAIEDRGTKLGMTGLWARAAQGIPIRVTTPAQITFPVAIGRAMGRTIFAARCIDETVRLWDAATGRLVGSPLGLTHQVTSMAVGQVDQRTIIVSGAPDGTIYVWERPSDASVGDPISGHSGLVTSVAAGEVKERIIVVSGSQDKTVRIWDARTGEPIGEPLTGHTSQVTSVAIGKVSGRTVIVSGANDGTVQRWDAATGEPVGEPIVKPIRKPSTYHDEFRTPVAIGQADGRTIIVAGTIDGTVLIWDAATGKPIGELFTAAHGYVSALAIGQADGRTIIVAGTIDGTVLIWDAATSEPIGEPFTGHSKMVNSVAVGQANDRTIIISASKDRTMRLWHITFRRRRLHDRIIRGHGEVTTVASVSNNERREHIVAFGYEYTLSTWRNGPPLRPGGDWSLPDAITAIAIVPNIGFAVAFGKEIAVFRGQTSGQELL
jgi:WD40 repeat protein